MVNRKGIPVSFAYLFVLITVNPKGRVGLGLGSDTTIIGSDLFTYPFFIPLIRVNTSLI